VTLHTVPVTDLMVVMNLMAYPLRGLFCTRKCRATRSNAASCVDSQFESYSSSRAMSGATFGAASRAAFAFKKRERVRRQQGAMRFEGLALLTNTPPFYTPCFSAAGYLPGSQPFLDYGGTAAIRRGDRRFMLASFGAVG